MLWLKCIDLFPLIVWCHGTSKDTKLRQKRSQESYRQKRDVREVKNIVEVGFIRHRSLNRLRWRRLMGRSHYRYMLKNSQAFATISKSMILSYYTCYTKNSHISKKSLILSWDGQISMQSCLKAKDVKLGEKTLPISCLNSLIHQEKQCI